MGTESAPAPGDETSATKVSQTAAGVVVSALVVFLIYLLVKAVDPGHVTARHEPGFVDLVVSNRTVLTVLRLAVLFLAVYAAYSCFELMRGGRPASRFGLVQADAAAALALDAGEDAVERIRVLEGELAAATNDKQFLIEYVQQLQEQLETRDDAADTDL